jgi:hypothetical protein
MATYRNTGNRLITLDSVLMIQLDDNLLIGSGTLRACYQFPEKPDLVVKVPLPDASGGDDANRKEWRSYRQITRMLSEIDHISRCRGFVDTDRGQGLICDCIRDHDGQVSETLLDIVVYREGCDLDYLVEVAEHFCNYLIANDLFLFDINMKNIACQRLRDGTYKPFAIDLKGPLDNQEFLQLSSRIKFLGRKKLKRRARQLLERIVTFHAQRESLKSDR